jgi:hypothetical protein
VPGAKRTSDLLLRLPGGLGAARVTLGILIARLQEKRATVAIGQIGAAVFDGVASKIQFGRVESLSSRFRDDCVAVGMVIDNCGSQEPT